MNTELSEADQELDDLYSQLKSGAKDNEVGWHEFSRLVQEFTRLLFRYKRMHDKEDEPEDQSMSNS